MQFTWPFMLGLLTLVPLFLLAYVWSLRRRQGYTLRYASLTLVREVRGPRSWRRHVPGGFFLTGLTTMIFALARPVALVPTPVNEGIIILTIDISGSMSATDLYPTRIEAAQAAAREFVAHQPEGMQIGVVAFSDYATLLQAPTTNHDQVLRAINQLTPDAGTAIGLGITTSLEAIADTAASDTSAMIQPNSTIVLLTDGENTVGPTPLEAATQASLHGVRIITIGVGSTHGIFVNAKKSTVHTSLDESTLRAIAALTRGNYYNAATETDLREIYASLSTQQVIKPQPVEMTAGLTGVAALLSLTAIAMSLAWFNGLP